ncbi:SusC/RagA family TonB-linked outer membrane protein [Adhaeribacter swui]|uniref:SusC/RagA family TonB-linked outer membrane protein n=1 Tax=Adhaeribacter swui TaxID=2086471 RepID=A0A7G7G2S9_9BACT|nr:SusC/RagA family TonB-linked outer membrane protein [Adhaeribacter swui]QNF31463.1 SusC/RagA family TonB-linked outer membrane protein [Adhaeribacter swui]
MITNKKKVLLRNALILACMASLPEVYAQDLLLANNQPSKNQITNTSAKKVPLTDVLQNLQQQYNVSFLYETQNLEGKVVSAGSLPSGTIEKGLDNLLTSVNLRYAKINERTYAIVPGTKNAEIRVSSALGSLSAASENAGNSPAMEWLASSRPAILPTYKPTKAPDWQITGTVTGSNGEGLPGVTVLLKGTTTGATTGPNGAFSLNIPEQAGTLVFSFIGYATKEVPVSGPGPVNVTLTEDTKALEEVVVVGYGTQKKESVTGAISSVSAKQISELPVPSVAQAIQGRAAGVSVVNTGTPGSNPIVRVRGVGSINFAADPLYVVDGVPTGGLANIDTKDIQSVEVLKDAAATAVYGSRAANGVILITTKNGGKDGKIRVTVDANYGAQTAWNQIETLNTQQYLQYANTLLNGALPPRLQPDNFNQPIYPGATQTYAQTNTNWQDALFRTAVLSQNNITISGGTDKSQFYTSGGYFKQEGITVGTGFDRYSYRMNSTHKLNSIFTVGENLMGSYTTQQYEPADNRTRIIHAIRSLPYLPVHDPTLLGGFRAAQNSIDGSDPFNPIRLAELDQNENRNFKILGNLFAEANITKWLKFRSTGGLDYYNNLQAIYLPIFNDLSSGSRPASTINNNRATGRTFVLTNQLTVDKTFNNHYINFTAVQERTDRRNIQENMNGNQPNSVVVTLNQPLNPGLSQTIGENVLLSYLGRLNYEFKGKYLLSASFRRDGFSGFAPGNKWGNFPGASIGWRVSEEPFMKGISQLSDLKLRASYGKIGFNGIGNYDYVVNANLNATVYPFGNTRGLGTYTNGLANPDLKWEITTMQNYGFDFGLLNNKIVFSAEYYQRLTDEKHGLILSIPTPNSFGFGGGGVNANVGQMKNSGLEFTAGYNQNEGAFKWSVNANVTTLKNEVVKFSSPTATLDEGTDQDFAAGYAITRTQQGQPIQSFYGWVVDKIYQNEEEVKADNAAAVAKKGAGAFYQTEKTAAGDIRFKDLNNDGVVNSDDRQFLGSYLPKVTYGINGTANYKNFDLSLFVQGVTGNKVYNATRAALEGGLRLFGAGTAVLDAWTPTHTDTNVPRMVNGDPNQNTRPSGRFLENGAFTRLRNITLGYTIPTATLSSITNGKVSSFRVYVTSQNLFTITKYSGLDPEVGQARGSLLTNGIDFGTYPQPRTFLGGIQVSF